jgi:hypothetical protein
VPEDRRRRAPLPTPATAVGGENAITERWPKCALQRLGLHEGVSLLDQHFLDEVWVRDEDCLAPKGT